MTPAERTEAAVKMVSVISDRNITPGDIQAICISIITLAYRKAGAPKSLAPEIAVNVMNQTMEMLFEGLPEKGGEE